MLVFVLQNFRAGLKGRGRDLDVGSEHHDGLPQQGRPQQGGLDRGRLDEKWGPWLPRQGWLSLHYR